MIIKYKKCRVVLSNELKVLENPNMINLNDNENLIPVGSYIKISSDDFTNFEDEIAINIKDKQNMKNHSIPSRLNGCCGLDGCDGLNQVCTNGHEVATEKSDCWTSHCVIFNKESIIIE